MTKKAKATKKTAAPKAAKGVIATIVDAISRDRGASKVEILEILVKSFPDRDPDGMARTMGIQTSKNCSSKERDEKRGLIYYKRR
jgi:hypothetical protein